ncbi:lytic transglycosylase domain-containing protein, partial [Escherichia coli]|nr:lytic transglycosylase domain-containing protein [Escherichia coli]
GWVNRDKKLATQRGLDAGVWFDVVATVNAGRSAANWRENRGYPQRILYQNAPRYLSWGGATCVQ